MRHQLGADGQDLGPAPLRRGHRASFGLQLPQRPVSAHRRRQSGHLPVQGPGCTESAGVDREHAVRHGQGRERHLDPHDRGASGPRLPQLLDDRRRRHRAGSRHGCLHRLRPHVQRLRGPRSGRRLLRAERRSARQRADQELLRHVDQRLAPHLRLHASGLREEPDQAVPGALPPAWRRRGRAGLDRDGAYERDPRQPARGRQDHPLHRGHGNQRGGRSRPGPRPGAWRPALPPMPAEAQLEPAHLALRGARCSAWAGRAAARTGN